MGMPDVYDNIERGVIVGLATARSAIAQYNLDEVLDHGTYGLNLYTTTQIMAMSWPAWNQMSEWQQYIFDEATGLELSLKAAELYDSMGEAARINIPGLTLNRLTPTELAAFAALSGNVINEYLADLRALGYDAQGHYEMMLRVRDALR
jgi:TRAP-type C4-dicarboxylate transport system substrate-binding protein